MRLKALVEIYTMHSFALCMFQKNPSLSFEDGIPPVLLLHLFSMYRMKKREEWQEEAEKADRISTPATSRKSSGLTGICPPVSGISVGCAIAAVCLRV